MILGSGRRRLPVKRGRCVFRLFMYIFMIFCLSNLHITRAKLRKFGNCFLQTVGKRGNRNGPKVKIQKAQTLYCSSVSSCFFVLFFCFVS